MKENLQRLVQLQFVDTQLHELEAAKGDLPDIVKDLTEKVKSLESEISQKEKELKKSILDRKNLEGLVNLSQEKIKKLQGQLYDVTTNKEYDALTTEIETEKSNLDENENKIIDLIEFEEKTVQEIDTLKKELKTEKKELKSNDSELNGVIKKNKEKETVLFNERKKIVPRIKKNIFNNYSRIHDYHKDGLAVVPVVRNACGGCYNTIPPQKIVEIRKMERIIPCEICGRILVWKDNGSVL
ncbi:hypothetical protein KAS50_03825 [bacterium]|nr:hypothetical protein [bacterium]